MKYQIKIVATADTGTPIFPVMVKPMGFQNCNFSFVGSQPGVF